MSIPLFMALTPAEFSRADSLPTRLAWMSVHLSLTGRGLSNIPLHLPPNNLIIFDDKVPWDGHSTEQVCKEMTTVLLSTKAKGLLLDFERDPTEQTFLLAKALSRCCKEIGVAMAAPVGYITDRDSALFISPVPCHIPAESLKPQRPLWLDISPICHSIRITEYGAYGAPIPYSPENRPDDHGVYWDDDLLCNYFSSQDADALQVTLFRDVKASCRLLKRLDPNRIQLAIGLWRDFASEQDKN